MHRFRLIFAAPRLASLVRKVIKLVWWILSFQLVTRLRERRKRLSELHADKKYANGSIFSFAQPPKIIEPEIDKLESHGVFNTGWYGPNQLSDLEKYRPVQIPSRRHYKLASERYDAQSRTIVEKYRFGIVPNLELPCFMRFGPAKLLRDAIDNKLPRLDLARSAAGPTYSIATTYYKHPEYFRRCAISVAELMNHDLRATGQKRIEWVVLNAAPDIDELVLKELMPESIRKLARIISECECGEGRCVVSPLNYAVRVASNNWLLFLDCDDRLAANTTIVLDHYIQKFEHCRYISSGIVDIDENDEILRWRRHAHRPAAILEFGIAAGHLKAIRRDLFDDIGEFNVEFPGCHDLDFAVRTALVEPILLIPDYLYYYRWHRDSQSGSRIEKLNRAFAQIRRVHLRELIDKQWPQSLITVRRSRPNKFDRGICFIRTQGRRLYLLAEAVQSVVDQMVPTVACIIVHGDQACYELVVDWLATIKPEAIVLHASEPGKKRGYPLNVGLDYAEKHADEFDFMCILDDDDIYYPFFTQRLTATLGITGCDLAYGLANQRELWAAPKPCHMPLPASCLGVANFIPTNAYIVRIDVVLLNHIRFREDLDYLEDWDFLVSVLEAGSQFQFVPETVSEFRHTGDGNTEIKRHPQHFAECQAAVAAHCNTVANKLGAGYFYRDVLAFDFDQRPALLPSETANILAAQEAYT